MAMNPAKIAGLADLKASQRDKLSQAEPNGMYVGALYKYALQPYF
jgi:hypothetical protein